MKLLLKIILSIVICIVLIIAGGVFFITKGLGSGSKMVINNVDLPKISDGTYTGSYKGGRWTNEVNVLVKDHKITSINIVKDVLIPKAEVTDEIVKRVIDKQSTDIDVVGGATVSCKAYLKSIENALNK